MDSSTYQRPSFHFGSDNSLKFKLYTIGILNKRKIQRYQRFLNSLDSSSPSILKLNKSKKDGQILSGDVRFGDSLDIEWFAIYLLIELSKFDKTLVIRAEDDYGDVLLIEAAEWLPSWMHHHDTTKRVYIHAGKVHVIPRSININQLQVMYSETYGSYFTYGQAAASYIRDINRPNLSNPNPKTKTKTKRRIHQSAAKRGKRRNNVSESAVVSDLIDDLISCVLVEDLDGTDTDETEIDESQMDISENLIYDKLPKTDTLADVQIQTCINEALHGLPDRSFWLKNRKNNNERIFGSQEDRPKLTTERIKLMKDEDLDISSISSSEGSMKVDKGQSLLKPIESGDSQETLENYTFRKSKKRSIKRN